MGTINVSDLAGLLAAIDTAAQSPAVDWVVLLAAGNYGAQGNETRILRKVFNGTVTDHNLGLPIPARNPASRATVAGGSVTFRSVVPLGAKMLDRLTILGSGPFVFEGIDFRAQATTDQGALPDGTTVTGQSFSWTQLDFGVNSTYPAARGAIVRDCRFGGRLHGSPSSRWIMSCKLAGSDDPVSVIEDCEFDGVAFGPSASTVRRTSVRQQAVDAMRIGFGGGIKPPRRVYGCTIFDPCPDPRWGAQHGDAIQVGAVSTTEPLWVEIYDNVIASQIAMQGLYMDDTAAGIGGVVERNLIITRHVNGMILWRADGLTVQGNTVVAFPNCKSGRAVTVPKIKVNSNSVKLSVTGNRANLLSAKAGLPGLTISGNLTVPVTGSAYNAAFAGPFTGGTGWPLAKVDWTSAATLRADLLRLFAPR